MCGRYRLSRRKQIVEGYFSIASGEDDWTPRYNIAPTQSVPIIRQNPKEPRRYLSLVQTEDDEKVHRMCEEEFGMG
jgi:putative SOS response-associated peptidase YedK